MPHAEAIQRGREFEAEAAEALGLKLTISSGNQHHDRSDARGRIRLSCKANPTTERTWSQTRRQLNEAIDLAVGTGEVPALAIEDRDGEQLLVMRLSDAVALLVEDAPVLRQPSRADVVRARARIPALLREED